MPIKVYDYRKDIANVIVEPEIRARFMRMNPAPAGRMHSHDLGGEIFLVLEGQCEFIVEDEKVTCGPGELIYVPKLLKHTLHAVGDQPCTVYLSVTPHVEPTHTHYDEQYNLAPPRYGGWRGKEHGDPNPECSTAELAGQVLEASRGLAALAKRNLDVLSAQVEALGRPDASADQASAKAVVDAIWFELRDTLRQVRTLEERWNALAPRSMPTA
jgi:quercetin dioxygenase-like cupin family protein